VELILIKYNELFDLSKATTINTTVKHTIEVKNTRPIVQRPYRKTSTQEKIIAEMCQQFYRDNIIRPSQSSWASPVVLQKKKDGSYKISRPFLFVTKGEPTGIVKAFIDWVLGPEGQKVVADEGIVPNA
jgi:ABC-type phosphate transport system substrate-binding protein